MTNNQNLDLAPMSNEVSKTDSFSSAQGFELAQRMAKALASSALIPKDFHNNVPNCMIALELSHRLGASPLMVMQNLNIIQGKPSFSSSFLIAMINSSRKFKGLKFKYTGAGDERSCQAYTADENAELIEGPTVSIAMAKAEGWYAKSGSKWKTMPDVMLAYRAASFFSRLYCPELTMGFKSVEEIEDAVIVEETPTGGVPKSSSEFANDLNKQLKKGKEGENV